jgi:hypothetical protein
VSNVNDVVERELTSVGRDFYLMVVPRLVASKKSGFDASSIYSLMVQSTGRVPVLVNIVLVVPSPAFVLESQVECLLQRFQRFLWL